MISISFDVAKDDVLALTCHYYDSSPVLRRQRVRTQLFVSLSLVAIGSLLALTIDYRPLGVVLLACAGLFAVRYPCWYRRGLRKSAEQFLAESSYEKTFGRYKLILTESGLTSTSSNGESKFAWKAITRVTLTPDHLLIFLAGPSGIPIPRTQVPDDAIRDVKAFVESFLGIAESNPAPNGGA